VKRGKEVVTIGETMALFRVAAGDHLAPDAPLEFGVGGAESNVAIGLTRLGLDVTWISAVGQDLFGRVIREVLAEQGVRVLADTDPGRKTGMMFKTPVPNSDPFVQYARSDSAASELVFSDEMGSHLAHAGWIHLSGILAAISSTGRETALAIVDYAVENGIPYSFDINYRQQLWSKSDARASLLALASDASIVFGGVSELEILVGHCDSLTELMRAVRDLGPSEVVAKLGSEGASALVGDEETTMPAHPVTVVDTVGAGDAFVAGYLSQRLRQESVERSLLRGTICGALACTRPGDWEGAPLLDEVLSLETGVLV
jgi:2-dehydro-3-deoxygluconokinase